MRWLIITLCACAGTTANDDANPVDSGVQSDSGPGDSGSEDSSAVDSGGDTGSGADTGVQPDPGLLDWVPILGGSFVMGSVEPEGEPREWPAHEVIVPSFLMARTEITAGQYFACWEAGACSPMPEGGHCYWKDPKYSHYVATCMTWYQARDFCAWAGGRLPTEAEWEYAARSQGQDHTYPWGDAPEPSCSHVVMDENGQVGCGVGTANPPCSKPEGNTEQGLCDMAGNVFEWNADWYNLNVGYTEHDSSHEAFQGGNHLYRVMRGGAIGSGEPFRTRSRTYHPEDFYYGGMGGRCARDE